MTRTAIRDVLRSRVGGFFANTLRSAPDTCDVCTGPSRSDVCPPCREHRLAFGDGLADLVVPLAYIRDSPYDASRCPVTGVDCPG